MHLDESWCPYRPTRKGGKALRILDVQANYRTKAFEVSTVEGEYSYPFAKLPLRPDTEDRVREVYADAEAGYEAFTYRLASGMEDTVHMDAVLEYNQDPGILNELLLYRLTVQATDAVRESGLSKREMIRRLGTSPSQFYRLLDPTYYGKSVGQLIALFSILGMEVDVVVSPPKAQTLPS